jgi:hypothetical protein
MSRRTRTRILIKSWKEMDRKFEVYERVDTSKRIEEEETVSCSTTELLQD